MTLTTAIMAPLAIAFMVVLVVVAVQIRPQVRRYYVKLIDALLKDTNNRS